MNNIKNQKDRRMKTYKEKSQNRKEIADNILLLLNGQTISSIESILHFVDLEIKKTRENTVYSCLSNAKSSI
jgi:hypothetical protein